MDGIDRTFGRAAGHGSGSALRSGADNDASGAERGRDSLFLTASLRLDDDSHWQEVRIRNLSAGGMMAELGRRVGIGTVALLDMQGIGRVSGKVAWCTEGRIGIALDRPIDPKCARKPVGGGTTTPLYAKSVPR